jgi:DNA primase
VGSARLRPDGQTIRTLARRLARGGDPWEDIGSHARPLGEARERLAALQRDER